MTKSGYTPEEPIAAIATALAPAALGVVRTSGKNAVELVSRCFSRPKALCAAQGNTLVYGWVLEPGTRARIDEVMVAVYRAPKSFTGEEMAEIFCHGGTSAVLGVYNALLACGFRAANRGEYTFRAFINGKADLTKAEAVREIIGAKTEESRSRAARRLQGALNAQIQRIKQQLLHELAAIEVGIEYPEDEHNIAESAELGGIKAAAESLERLSRSWAAEKLYQDGAHVVLCGKTNAGKSSLFNVLLKEERAIVSDVHGTTRDWIESWSSFGGIPVRLFDTAGLRHTEDVIEQAGVERTKELLAQADVLLYVVDSSLALSAEDKAFLREYSGAGAAASKGSTANAESVDNTDNASSVSVKTAVNTECARNTSECATSAMEACAGGSAASGKGNSSTEGAGNAGSIKVKIAATVADITTNEDSASNVEGASNAGEGAISAAEASADGGNVDNAAIKLVLVLNKCDKTEACANAGGGTESAAKEAARLFPAVPRICTSAKSGGGIRELCDSVFALLKVGESRESLAAGLGSERQKAAVEDALDSLRHGLSCARQGFGTDALVQDIEDALASLGELTGEITSDDILESVFSSFCVGK